MTISLGLILLICSILGALIFLILMIVNAAGARKKERNLLMEIENEYRAR